MYFVKLDGQTFYDPRLEDYKIFNPKLKLEVNKAGGFDFTVYPSHPMFARIFKLKSIIEVYQDNTLLFRGRVLDDELAFDKAKKIICEGELAYFNDTILRPYEYTGGVRGYLELLVNQHNSQVPVAKQFTVGNVTVTDPNDLIVRSDKTYPVCWDVLESKLVKSLGGYLVVRRVGSINYLDYLADSNKQSLQTIELGKNLLDLATKSSATELYTAILPLGKEINEDTGEKLTIKSVNGGLDYIKDDEAIGKYGFIMKSVEWPDVTIASNLLTKARQELAQLVKLSLSLTLTAIDLSMTDATIDEFRVFEYVNVNSSPHGIKERLLVEKQELNLTNPTQDKLTIGVQRKSLTETQIQTDKAVENVVTIKGPKGDKGDPGERGNDGIAGKDGVGLTSTTINYALSTSGTVSPINGWTASVPSLVKGQYLWTRTVWSYTDGTSETGYSVTYISKDGNNGSDGIAGKDGVGIKTTAITYANSTSGVTQPLTGWTTTIPNVPAGNYLWTRTVWTYTDDTTETGYSVARMGVNGAKGDQGVQGPQGLVGPKGADGQQFYTWLKYADAPTSGMSDDPTGKKYIGLAYNKTTPTESTTYSDYTWSLAQGPQGDQGTQGPKGEDGQTTYTWIKYATSAAGANMSDSPTGKTYIGLAYNKTTATESNVATDYTWALIQGPKGDQGIQGPAGANGISQYVHIRYSANSNGSAMTTTPQANTAYIGLANTTSATAPATNTSYTWTKTKGEQGNQGIQGPAGTNGQTTYTWVKYADTATGTGMSDSPDGKLYIGLAFNKTKQTESSTASDYTWSLMPQNIEIGARNLLLRSTETVGYWIDSAGNVASNNGTSVSDYIAITPLSDYMFTKTSSTISDPTVGGYFRFAWYTEDKTYIARMANSKNEFKWTAPSNAYYIRISYPDDSQVKFEKGNIATDWTPAPEDIEAELNEKADNEYVTEVVTTLNTTIEETAGLIRTEVAETYTEKGEFTTYQETVSTEFQQTKEAFDFTFNDLITQIETLDGETQAQFAEIVKYIRFVDGNIILGQVGNELELKIQLDRIQFLQSGVEVAYFSNNKLYVTDGEFINSLKLGNFAFMPRENGSLDFKKVVN